MKIYTKGGDKGQTSLYSNERVNKDAIRVEAYGTIDELGAALGVAKHYITDQTHFAFVEGVQKKLFRVAGELATASDAFPYPVKEEDIETLERQMDIWMKDDAFPALDKFIMAGSSKASAYLHVARTICRRAERRIVTLSGEEAVRPTLIKYVNRLSDTIYTLARLLEEKVTYIEFEDIYEG